FGLFAPRGVPDAVKAKLDKAVSTTLSNPRVRERLANLDIEPGYAPGDALKTKLENEIANWTKFIDAHGIKPEKPALSRRITATPSSKSCASRIAREDRMQRRTVLGLLVCAILFCAPPPAATAQDLSSKPIRLLVGLAAGGATDVMARLVAQKMS